MRILGLLLFIGGLSLMTSCASHAPCPGLGGENIDKEKMQIPVQTTELELDEEKA